MPRYLANPTPEQSLAAHLASSGASSLLEVKFARWLDSNDALGYMRYLFTIPTVESMNRKGPRPEKPLTADHVLAQNQRERSARQAGRRRLSPASSKTNDTKQNRPTTSRSGSKTTKKANETEGVDESGSESEDGYMSSSSVGSRDGREPSTVRQDVIAEVLGSNDTTSSKTQDENEAGGADAKTENSDGPPDSLKPESHENVIYLAGNSLGLQSRSSYQLVNEELVMWQTKAVTGWFNSHHDRPWKSYAEDITAMMAGLVGASKAEVGIMGTLTANLHLLMCSFYRPTKERYKIMYESKAFPSDNYAFASQAEMHGYDKKDALVRVAPRQGEYCLRIEDILDTIEKEGDQVAVVFFSGVNYFTGQVFDMQRITEAAHKKGCLVGWDLAHGVGNIPLDLHKWNVDFAVWCTYKYLNSGPGGIASFFVHEKHSSRPRLAGWWGNNLTTRFNMAEDFDPAPGAAGFVISTPSILALASLFGALECYLQCGKEESSQQEAPASTRTALAKLRKKSLLLTAYLNCLFKASSSYVPLAKIDEYEESIGEAWKDPEAKQFKPAFTILTPEKADERGCQLSILLLPRNIGMLKHTNQNLEDAGVYGDEREPDVIRFSPVPLYNTFKECYMTAKTFEWALKTAAVQLQGRHGKRTSTQDV